METYIEIAVPGIVIVLDQTEYFVPDKGHSSDALFLGCRHYDCYEWIPITEKLDFFQVHRKLQRQLEIYYGEGLKF
jgi:hypothetical protein